MGICGAWGAYRPLPYVYEGGSARRFRAVGAVALCVPAAPRDAMPFNNKKSQLGDVCARAVPYNVQFQRYPQGRGDPGEVAHRLGARPPPPSADTTAFSACCEGKVWFGPLCTRTRTRTRGVCYGFPVAVDQIRRYQGTRTSARPASVQFLNWAMGMVYRRILAGMRRRCWSSRCLRVSGVLLSMRIDGTFSWT